MALFSLIKITRHKWMLPVLVWICYAYARVRNRILVLTILEFSSQRMLTEMFVLKSASPLALGGPTV
jgi:hypothetical protein